MTMNKKRALQLAKEWAQGHRCTLRDGEAAEYHAMFASMLEKSTPNELLTLEQLLDMKGVPILVVDTSYYCYVNGRPEYEKEAVNGETNRC